MDARQELEQQHRSEEAEAIRHRYLDTHGEMITQEDIEAWKREHNQKENSHGKIH